MNLCERRNPGIYVITHRNTGKKYVGKDYKLPNRPNRHLVGKDPSCKRVHNAVMMHGRDAFDVEIIRYPGISPEALCEVEKLKIRQYKSHRSQGGYNLTWGGDGVSGYRHTPEAKGKMSKAKRGKPTWNKGITHTAETCLKISTKAKGRKHTAETRAKMSKTRAGMTYPSGSYDSRSGKNNHKYVDIDNFKDLIVNSYTMGVNIVQISKAMGVSRQTITRRLEDWHIKKEVTDESL